jgi:hypothetical protein
VHTLYLAPKLIWKSAFWKSAWRFKFEYVL